MNANTVHLAKRLRHHVLRMVYAAKSSHVGSCLSAADLVAVLYGHVLRVDPKEPRAPHRDRFIASKGHAAALYYAVLAESGFFPLESLSSFCADGTLLSGHVNTAVDGVDFSTGSLGHGLNLGVGIALGCQATWRDGHSIYSDRPSHTYVLLSDGECDEGSTWEAAMFAGAKGLTTLTAIVDYNKIQSFGTVPEVLDLEPFADKWRSFRWDVLEVDGHNHDEILRALHTPAGTAPRVVLAHTVKGKGVSFMENNLLWHYRSPNEEQLARALEEIG
jgi:transketolase